MAEGRHVGGAGYDIAGEAQSNRRAAASEGIAAADIAGVQESIVGTGLVAVEAPAAVEAVEEEVEGSDYAGTATRRLWVCCCAQ